MPTTESSTRDCRARLGAVAALLALLAALPTRPASGADDVAEDDRSVVELRGFNRARYERLAPQYRAGLGGSDTVLALQTSLALEANWDRLSFVGEILDARAELNDSDSVFAGVVNTLEPVQTYFTWNIGRTSRDDSQSSLRAHAHGAVRSADRWCGFPRLTRLLLRGANHYFLKPQHQRALREEHVAPLSLRRALAGFIWLAYVARRRARHAHAQSSAITRSTNLLSTNGLMSTLPRLSGSRRLGYRASSRTAPSADTSGVVGIAGP